MTHQTVIRPTGAISNRRTQASDNVLQLCTNTIRRAFRTQRAPMPIVAVRADDDASAPGSASGVPPSPAAATTEVIEVLYALFRAGGIPCRILRGMHAGPAQVPHLAAAGQAAGPGQSPAANGQSGTGAAQQAPEAGPREYGLALAMVRNLSVADGWTRAGRAQYKPLAFPRSSILRAIEDEAGVVDLLAGTVFGRPAGGSGPGPGNGAQQPPARPSPDKVVSRLHLPRRRRPGRATPGITVEADSTTRPVLTALGAAVSPSSTVGALLVAALIAKVVASASTLTLGAWFAVTFAALAALKLVQENLAPLSWLGAANQWFTTTTFIGPVGDLPAAGYDIGMQRWRPRLSWRVREDRATFVAEQLITAQFGPDPKPPTEPGGPRTALQPDMALRYYLQLRVLALLEDLRANYRRRTLDLRHRKRTWQPMLFLPAVDSAPAARVLIQAISDVRSRRSEQDPLLVLAGSQTLHKEAKSLAQGTYEEWLSTLRIDQSPSLGPYWPWVMDYPCTRTALSLPGGGQRPPVVRHSPWSLWSRWTLAILVAIAAGLGLYGNHRLGAEYCGGGVLNYFAASHDIVSVPGARGSEAQCVGIEAADAQAFVPPDGGVSLANTIPGRGQAASPSPGSGSLQLGQITATTAEAGIRQQNAVAEEHGSYVTFIYAGPLTTTGGQQETQALDAVKELASLYAWQYGIDTIDGNPVMVRIDIANGGQDMASQVIMAGKIIAVAQRDPTVVGVIGLGRDTQTTPTVVQELADAGLVVVDTTSSDDYLPSHWNYFGMAATNSEEATALWPFAARGSVAARHAVVLERQPSRQSPDLYSKQQAMAAVRMFHAIQLPLIGVPDQPPGPLTFQVQGNQGIFEGSNAASTVCQSPVKPSVVYLAGRSDDLRGLMDFIKGDAKCFAPEVTVLSGDDLTKNEFNEPGTPFLPQNVTLYYTALTNTLKTGPGSGFTHDLEQSLGVRIPAGQGSRDYSNPVFTDGILALAYDAAHALYTATENAASAAGGNPLTRSSIAATLRCMVPITNGATGSIGFSGVHHGLQVMEVTQSRDGTPDLRPDAAYYDAPRDGACAPNVR